MCAYGRPSKAQGRHQIPAWKTEMGTKFHLLVKDLLAIDSFWEGRVHFLKSVHSGKLTPLQRKATYPRIYGELLLALIGVLKKDQCWAGREEIMNMEGLGKKD